MCVSTGGLDNNITIHRLPGATSKTREAVVQSQLAVHQGYISCVKYLHQDSELLSASGDGSCVLWDVEKTAPKTIFHDHTHDVMCLASFPANHTFLSGSVDMTAKLWDCRIRPSVGPVMTYRGHESDINAVEFFPDGFGFATASDDMSCRLWDFRSHRPLNRYANDRLLTACSSLAFTKSGRFMICAYDDFTAFIWDTMLALLSAQLDGHERRVSCVAINDNGRAVATGSWDMSLRIWAPQ